MPVRYSLNHFFLLILAHEKYFICFLFCLLQKWNNRLQSEMGNAQLQLFLKGLFSTIKKTVTVAKYTFWVFFFFIFFLVHDRN